MDADRLAENVLRRAAQATEQSAGIYLALAAEGVPAARIKAQMAMANLQSLLSELPQLEAAAAAKVGA